MSRTALNFLLMIVLFAAVISRAFLSPGQYQIAFTVFLLIYAVGIGLTMYSNRKNASRQELMLNGLIVLAILYMIIRQWGLI